MHKVEEGHIGVYFRAGALLKGTTGPGLHFRLPFLTRYEPVQITMQTDKVTNIPVHLSSESSTNNPLSAAQAAVC